MTEWASENPHDFFSVLERNCGNAGFSWTGVRPRTITYSDLMSSGALVNLQSLLESESFSGCVRSGDIAAVKSDVVSKMDGKDWQARCGLVTGVAGSGKSTLIKTLLTSGEGRVVLGLPNSSLLKGVFSGCPNAFLIDDLFTSEIHLQRYQTMLVDEFTKVHMCEVMCLCVLLGVKNLVCFGDFSQSLNYKAGSVVNYGLPVLAKSDTSKRFGKKIAGLMSGSGCGNVRGSDSVNDDVSFEDLMGKLRDMSTVLVASEESQKELADCDIDSFLWSEVQGQTFDVVEVVLYDEYDDKLICDSNIRTVLLSRARKCNVLRFGPNIRARFESGNFGCGGNDSSYSGDTLREER
ncbi:first triple-gene-block protein [Burdock mottle virus]|uniref:First triple-gene-block protein n=1 Tax=Burdock mottle virus TaxID=1324959 RepID=S6B129_9VIRU|nr:first triple-gene-block protein [Burdock mottle virus]BAN62706.1 first triple-gene-block protein [Burdock mottle virus]